MPIPDWSWPGRHDVAPGWTCGAPGSAGIRPVIRCSWDRIRDFAITNCYVQETVRAYLHGWYQELVTSLPRIERGYVYPPEGPGLGIALRPEVKQRPDALIQRSEA
jgi:hypothetical protein